jgi:ParB/RepB/Spo0J family partition protein
MPKPRRVQVTPELVMPDRAAPDRHVDLSSLFAAPNVQALNIGLDRLAPNPFQPRQDFTPQQLEELAEGMRAHGFFGTLLARPDPADEARYQLAYGERRLRASRLAGLLAIPVIVRPLSDQEMLEIAIAENVLREDLNPIEEAEGYQQMMTLFGYSERKLAQRIGKTRGYIAHRLRILRASPEVQALVRERPDTLRYVAPLLAVPDAAIRRQLVDEVRAGTLISSDIGERAAALAAEAAPGAAAGEDPPRRDGAGLRRDRLSTATRALSHFLGSKRLPMDPDTAAHMLQLRTMIDQYLALWEAQSQVRAADGGSRVIRHPATGQEQAS